MKNIKYSFVKAIEDYHTLKNIYIYDFWLNMFFDCTCQLIEILKLIFYASLTEWLRISNIILDELAKWWKLWVNT